MLQPMWVRSTTEYGAHNRVPLAHRMSADEKPTIDPCDTTSATYLHEWRTQLVNPLTLVVYVLTLNVILTTSGVPGWLTVVTLAVAGTGLIIVAPLKLSIGWASFMTLCTLCHLVIPTLYPSSSTVLVGFVAKWMILFAGMFAAFVAAGFALDIHQLSAALIHLHAPGWIYVPLMVVIRFFPMAARDLRAIVEAMSLRGLTVGPLAALRHPLRLGEYIVIPFLACAARVADELSAAAIIKGLGASQRRTSMVRLRFQIGDGVTLGVAFVLLGTLCWQVSTT